jgi:hypothetical protein
MSDQYHYTVGEVVKLLPAALNPNWTSEMPMPMSSYNDGTKVRSGKPISEGGDFLVKVLDVRRALKAGYHSPLHIVQFLNGEVEVSER